MAGLFFGAGLMVLFLNVIGIMRHIAAARIFSEELRKNNEAAVQEPDDHEIQRRRKEQILIAESRYPDGTRQSLKWDMVALNALLFAAAITARYIGL